MLLKALTFLRLVDPHDGLLSLSNIALIVVIVKIAITQSAGVTDLGALLLALANYNAKKHLATKVQVAPNELDQTVDELKRKVNSLMIRAGLSGK